jgi:hypothetical protein
MGIINGGFFDVVLDPILAVIDNSPHQFWIFFDLRVDVQRNPLDLLSIGILVFALLPSALKFSHLLRLSLIQDIAEITNCCLDRVRASSEFDWKPNECPFVVFPIKVNDSPFILDSVFVFDVVVIFDGENACVHGKQLFFAPGCPPQYVIVCL